MSARVIGKISGNHIKIGLDDWRELVRRLKGDFEIILQMDGEGCDEWCQEVCERMEGCDFSFGEPPECGAFCNNGEPVLQEP